MTVAFDATVLSYNREGIGNYVLQLLLAIAEILKARGDQELKIIAYVFPGSDSTSKLVKSGIICREIVAPSSPFKGLKTATAIASQAKNDHVDCLVSTHSHLLPLLFKNTIYLVHDISPLTHPQFYPRQQSAIGQGIFQSLFKSALKRSKLILTTTEFVKQQIIDYTKKSPLAEKIKVIGAGPGEWINVNAQDFETEGDTHRSESGVDSSAVLGKYHLEPGKYFLAIGTVSPRKNYEFLIESFRASHSRLKLVIAGKKGWAYEEFDRLINQSDPSSQVIYLDFVPNEELRVLMLNCLAFVSLSKYEGFGMPVLEAILLQKEVIASDIPVFREILPAEFVNFTSTSSMPQVIDTLNKVASGHKKITKEASKAMYEKHNWTLVADNLLKLLLNHND